MQGDVRRLYPLQNGRQKENCGVLTEAGDGFL